MKDGTKVDSGVKVESGQETVSLKSYFFKNFSGRIPFSLEIM